MSSRFTEKVLGWKSAVVCLEVALLISASPGESLSSSCFLAGLALTVGTTRLTLFSLGTVRIVPVTFALSELCGRVEVVALASNVAAEIGIEGLAGDGLHIGLGVVDVEVGATLIGAGVSVTSLSSALGADSTLASAFNALGLSLAILERSSVCLPLTALETVSSVFLTRDMCWLRPADHREADVFKFKVLVWSPSLCRIWLALQSHPLRPVILR